MKKIVKCNNEHCVYNVLENGIANRCAKKDGIVTITKTGECESYWLSVASGLSVDMRKTPELKVYQMLRY
jgi:hypothetical protein